MARDTKSAETLPVCVVGGGAVGLAGALALAGEGIRVTLIAPPAPAATGRTIALFDGSVRFLRALGVWEALEPLAAPLERLSLIDATDSLFRPPPVTFAASEIGLDAFGWNIELTALLGALGQALDGRAEVEIHATTAMSLAVTEGCARLALANGEEIACSLVIAADGGRSMIRDAAGIETREWSYPQNALTTIVAHDRPHRSVSTEFHTRSGPFTFVPMPGRRSSLVWVTQPERAAALYDMSDDELARAIESQSQHLLGEIRIDGPRGLIPLRGLMAKSLAAPGVLLAGEAAHMFPPIGAQGLNLGLRDVAYIFDILADARAKGTRFSDASVGRQYERARRLDVGLRGASVDILNRTLLMDFLPADALRGVGLLALDMIGPLRRFVMRVGVAPPGAAPRLMRSH